MKRTFFKPVLFVLAIALLLIITLLWIYHLPRGCNNLSVSIGCAEVNGSGEIVWYTDPLAVRSSLDIEQNRLYMAHLAAVLRTIPCQKTEEKPSDIQVVEFDFLKVHRNQNGAYQGSDLLSSVLVGYDFYQEKVYIRKGEFWYQVNQSNTIDNMIEELLSNIFQYRPGRWLGQSTYSAEEFVETNFTKPTFRYHLRWNVESQLREYRSTNFKNNTFTEILNEQEAVKRAAEELGFEKPVAVTFYDETCGWWMVELYDDVGQTWDTLQDQYDFLSKNVYTVIINEHGMTKEIYQSMTRGRAFIEIPLE